MRYCLDFQLQSSAIHIASFPNWHARFQIWAFESFKKSAFR